MSRQSNHHPESLDHVERLIDQADRCVPAADWEEYAAYLDSLDLDGPSGRWFDDDPPDPGAVLYRLPDGRPAVYKDGEGAA
jgi:hypothetical protein